MRNTVADFAAVHVENIRWPPHQQKMLFCCRGGSGWIFPVTYLILLMTVSRRTAGPCINKQGGTGGGCEGWR